MRIVYTRLRAREPVLLDDSEKVVEYLNGVFDENPTVESFVVIPVDRKNRALGRIVVAVGGPSSCIVSCREIFKVAFLCNATGFFLAHNHPSGDPRPSKADDLVTSSLRRAARLLEFDLIDHVIIGDLRLDPRGIGHFSYESNGMVETVSSPDLSTSKRIKKRSVSRK